MLYGTHILWGVQHRLRFCLDQFSYVKMAAFQFIINQGNREVAGSQVRRVEYVGNNKNSLLKEEV
jgi:hypothetical protein